MGAYLLPRFVLVALRDSLASGDEDACPPPETTEDC